MLPENLFHLLDEWSEHGWLRPLDRAFTGFLKTRQPDAPDLVLFSAALASHQLGRGHVCLDLRAVLADPDGALALPPEGGMGEPITSNPSRILDGVSFQTWARALRESALVAPGAGNTPLVFDAGRLYLRRYWQYTQRVARLILERLAEEIPVPDNLAERLDQLFTPLRGPQEQTKKEGSEFDHTVLVFPDRMNPVLTRELIYTAVTRSRGRFTLANPRMDLMPKSVKRRVHRASGLGALFRPAPEPETAAGGSNGNHHKHRNRLQSRGEKKSPAKEIKQHKKRRTIKKKEAFKKHKVKKAVQLSLFD